MPRRPRLVLPDVPLHIVQRGHNRQACFFSDEDYRAYLGWLEKYAEISGCSIHAYVLMTNHVHLLLTPRSVDSAGNLMKRLGQRYVQYINRVYRRRGTLWEGRFRSCLTQEEAYVLGCYRYVELNPVRANMVKHPGDYPWSSYRCNAQGEASDIVTPHALYFDLSGSVNVRRKVYRDLFRHQLAPGLVDEIRRSTNGNYVLGSTQFQEQIAAVMKRRVTRGTAGRPRKSGPRRPADLRDTTRVRR